MQLIAEDQFKAVLNFLLSNIYICASPWELLHHFVRCSSEIGVLFNKEVDWGGLWLKIEDFAFPKRQGIRIIFF